MADLTSAETIFSMAGSTFGTVVLTNSLHHAFGLKPRRIGFIAAMALGVIGAVYFADQLTSVRLLAGVVNGCAIYCAAVGASTMTVAGDLDRGGTAPPDAAPPGAFDPGTAGAPMTEELKLSPRKRRFWVAWW